MRVVVDRFEGDFAVVEICEGEFASLPKVLVKNAVEGDVIDILINKEETLKRQESVEDLMNKLFE